MRDNHANATRTGTRPARVQTKPSSRAWWARYGAAWTSARSGVFQVRFPVDMQDFNPKFAGSRPARPIPGRLTRATQNDRNICVTRRESGIAAAGEQEVVMPSGLDNPAMIENDDLVGVADRRQAVRDRDRRASG